MSKNIVLIKNMVCLRCILAVEDILQKESIPFQKVTFGEIHLIEKLTENQRSSLNENLNRIGFEVIDNHTSGLIEKIKQLIIKKARNEIVIDDVNKKLSLYISEAIHHEYTYLSGLFSAIEGRTIENYFIEQRIEKAKELLVYDQLTLSQIAFELEFSNVAHLSLQFKKITGLTPTYFKEIGITKRKGLDKV